MSIIGKTLNERFHILKSLAKGGFGHTYLAEDLTFNSRQKCVVKHLNPSTGNLPYLDRIKDLFEREADTLAKLSLYSNLIPKLIDRFEEAGELYLVQEFIDGEPLSAELTPGKRFTEEATIELLLQILTPLDYCHRENLLHRDLKPANIMRRHQTGELVLIDFGLAKDMGASITHESYGGTPGYAPEEQQYGFPVLASDVYAVGMIAIQALTGKHPAELSRNPQTREWEWDKYLIDKPYLENVLCKMIQLSVDSRYQNAQEALADVQFTQLCSGGPFWKKSVDRIPLVKSSVKGRMPTQMIEDLIIWNQFTDITRSEDEKAQKSRQLGLIDDLPFTYVLRKIPDNSSKYAGSYTLDLTFIDLYSIEYEYQEAHHILRGLAPKISDAYFPVSRNICIYSDWMNGFIPITNTRLARLKDIYESFIYFERLTHESEKYDKYIREAYRGRVCHERDFKDVDGHVPFFVEMLTSLDSHTIIKILRTIENPKYSERYMEISYFLETIYADTEQKDLYLFNYRAASF